MKTFYLIISLAYIGFIITQAVEITALNPISSTKLGVQTIACTLIASGLLENDEVYFSKATTAAEVNTDKDLKIPITAATPTPLSITPEFKSSGAYKVYVKRAGVMTQQTGLTFTITVAAPAADIVSSISPATGEKNKEVTVTFTLKDASSLLKYHRLVFSTAAAPTATDLAVEMTANVATTSTTGKYNFTTDGNYTLFVDNGQAVKQGTIILKISSSFLTMSFGAMLCLLLF